MCCALLPQAKLVAGRLRGLSVPRACASSTTPALSPQGLAAHVYSRLQLLGISTVYVALRNSKPLNIPWWPRSPCPPLTPIPAWW